MFTSILTILASVVPFIFDRIGVSRATKKHFIESIRLAAKDTKSAQLTRLHKKQLKQFEDEPFTPDPGQPVTMDKKLGAFGKKK